MPSILFVCTANICRSPMAEGLFKHLVSARPDADQWRIESAGTWAMDGFSAAGRTQAVLAEKGLDISAHRSRTVTKELLESFDLVLTMESGHKEALNIEFPQLAGRVWMLSEMLGYRRDIHDPISGPLEEFRLIANDLEQILAKGLEAILRKAAENAAGAQTTNKPTSSKKTSRRQAARKPRPSKDA